MSCAEWLPLDLNRDSPDQQTGRSRRALGGSWSTRNVDHSRRGIWEPAHRFHWATLPPQWLPLRAPARRALGAGDAATWGVVMRGGVLGGRRRTFVRAFGPAGSVSLMNQGLCGVSGNHRSGALGRRSQFAARPIRWSDLARPARARRAAFGAPICTRLFTRRRAAPASRWYRGVSV